MKTCNACGAANEDSNKNCTTCGTPFDMGQPQMEYNQFQGGYNQPQVGYDQYQGGYGQPQTGYDQYQGGYGQAQMGYNQYQGGYGQPQMGYAKPKSSKRKYIIIAVIVVVILAIVGIVMLVKKKKEEEAEKKDNQKPRDMVEKVVEAYEDGDAKYLASITPSFFENDYDYSYYDDIEEYYEEIIDVLEDMEVEMEFVSMDETEFYSKQEIKELQEEIYDEYDERVNIQKACSIEAELLVSMDVYGTYEEEESMDFVFIKMNGKWYMYEGMN